jgi:Fis family transcriptional regulator
MKEQLESLVKEMYDCGILYSEGLREFKKRYIMNVLEQNKGNQCHAAKQLGMHRNTLSRTIFELKINRYLLQEQGRYTERKPIQKENYAFEPLLSSVSE